MSKNERTEETEKKIFARNLRRYIELNKKSQIDVAKDLGINASTLNMWCNGNSMPLTGTLRKVADYFGIGLTDLVDEKSNTDEEYSKSVFQIGKNDERFAKIIVAYQNMPKKKKDLICDFFEEFIL